MLRYIYTVFNYFWKNGRFSDILILQYVIIPHGHFIRLDSLHPSSSKTKVGKIRERAFNLCIPSYWSELRLFSILTISGSPEDSLLIRGQGCWLKNDLHQKWFLKIIFEGTCKWAPSFVWGFMIEINFIRTKSH